MVQEPAGGVCTSWAPRSGTWGIFRKSPNRAGGGRWTPAKTPATAANCSAPWVPRETAELSSAQHPRPHSTTAGPARTRAKRGGDQRCRPSGVSDPGEDLVAAARSAGREVICVPGPCAATTALVSSGLPSNYALKASCRPRQTTQGAPGRNRRRAAHHRALQARTGCCNSSTTC